MKNLYTSYYFEPNDNRRAELDFCLQRNQNGGYIDNIHIITEDQTVEIPINGDSVFIHRITNRPKYSDLFDLANQFTDDSTISIIANTDIYFDDSINLVESVDMTNICFALSRWDIQEDGAAIHHFALDSQDSWIFCGKIKPVYAEFEIGFCGCDNRIAHELSLYYNVINASRSIKTYHLQLSNYRNYDPNIHTIEGPYKLIHPTYLEIK